MLKSQLKKVGQLVNMSERLDKSFQDLKSRHWCINDKRNRRNIKLTSTTVTNTLAKIQHTQLEKTTPS